MEYRSGRAFTLVEMMVATTILVLLMGIILGITSQVGRIWTSVTAKGDSFTAAQAAFDGITRKLSMATLNTHYDYFDINGKAAGDAGYNQIPARYGRQSELHFIMGKALLSEQLSHALFFQARLGRSEKMNGLSGLLNSCGYYIAFRDEERPAFFNRLNPGMPSRYRFRLMEFTQQSEDLSLYVTNGNTWFTTSASTTSRPLANNILALAIIPHKANEKPESTSLAGNCEYNSRVNWSGAEQPATMNQLPPVVRVVMVAIDETSANRTLQNISNADSAAQALGVNYGVLFQNAANLSADLVTVEDQLTRRGINYRVFQTDVAVREARWSN